MNANSSFCQSDLDRAEQLIAGINDIEVRAHQAIPGFVNKLADIEKKVKAYHEMETIWQQFLQTKSVDLKELESIDGVKTSCEKRTLAKFSFMQAYQNYCDGNVNKAKAIIQNRTLRLAEKTTLRVEDVEGLAPELAKMKKLFQNITDLENSWNTYVKTGESPGFTTELPLFPCNPIPNMKEWVLKGAADVCSSGAIMLEKIKDIQAKSGVVPDGTLAKKVKELEGAIEQKEADVLVLNDAWDAFLETNKVASPRKYGYEYCSNEPLIKAYILDGFANTCANAEESLRQISDFPQADITGLDGTAKMKINELQELYIRFQNDDEDINSIWNRFVAQGDTLYGDYQLADYYCDHVYDVKSWVIQGLLSDCKQGILFLQQIDEVRESLEFEFTIDVRCRINKLRIKTWDCQYQAVEKLAKIQSPDAVEERIKELMEEYGMEARPEVCVESE